MLAYSVLAQETVGINHERLIAALVELKVDSVVIHYEGSGDSGDIAEWAVTPPEAMATLKVAKISYRYIGNEYVADQGYVYHADDRETTVFEALHDFALTWVESNHSGWEINEGACGQITIKVQENTCELDHTEYYTDQTEYHYEL